MSRLRLTTWNLCGRERPDVDAVAAVLEDLGAEVVVLQEVQRRQAEAIGRALGRALGRSGVPPRVIWRRKHWPVVVPAEGLAIVSRRPVTGVGEVVLAHAPFWSSRRRIAVAVDVDLGGWALRVVDVHLGSGVSGEERRRQASVAVGLATGTTVVAGDLNARPDADVLDLLRTLGLRDAWTDAHGGEPGPTNWRDRPRHGPAVQRLDYVLVDEDLRVVSAEVPAFGDPGFERYGELSDHLPVTVTLERP